MKNIILTTILAFCSIGLIVSLGIMIICVLSKYSKLFFRIYLFIFEHEDYKVYKELKSFLKGGSTIPVCSRFADTNVLEGYYFMIFDNKEISLWKDNKPVLTAFHKFILDELIKLDNAQEAIEITWNHDNAYRELLNERIAQLEKKNAEGVEKLAELHKEGRIRLRK